MTQAPGPHLSPDDVENWLSGILDAERTRHLDLCAGVLRSRSAGARDRGAALRHCRSMSPSAGFADRVMASVTVADPFSLRSLQQHSPPHLRHPPLARHRGRASRWRSSAPWRRASRGSLANQDVLASVGLGSWPGQPGRLARPPRPRLELHRAAVVRERAKLRRSPRPSRRRDRRGVPGLPERHARAPPPAGFADPAGGPCRLGAGGQAGGRTGGQGRCVGWASCCSFCSWHLYPPARLSRRSRCRPDPPRSSW